MGVYARRDLASDGIREDDAYWPWLLSLQMSAMPKGALLVTITPSGHQPRVSMITSYSPKWSLHPPLVHPQSCTAARGVPLLFEKLARWTPWVEQNPRASLDNEKGWPSRVALILPWCWSLVPRVGVLTGIQVVATECRAGLLRVAWVGYEGVTG